LVGVGPRCVIDEWVIATHTHKNTKAKQTQPLPPLPLPPKPQNKKNKKHKAHTQYTHTTITRTSGVGRPSGGLVRAGRARRRPCHPRKRPARERRVDVVLSLCCVLLCLVCLFLVGWMGDVCVATLGVCDIIAHGESILIQIDRPTNYPRHTSMHHHPPPPIDATPDLPTETTPPTHHHITHTLPCTTRHKRDANAPRRHSTCCPPPAAGWSWPRSARPRRWRPGPPTGP
jgi:hypothetical protein